MKVVSFLPSATEMVYALGQGASLVGRSHECDYPPEARSLPIVMRAKADQTGRSSGEIDAWVQAQMTAHQELYTVDQPTLERLAPDVILTQDLCHVCSITPEGLADSLGHLGHRPEVLVLSPTKLEHLFRDIRTVAKALHVEDRGKALCADLERRIAAATPGPRAGGAPRPTFEGEEPEQPARARPRTPSDASLPRVLVLEWLDPPMVAGLWVPDMIRRAGGVPLLVKSGGPSPRVTWDTLRGVGADLVVIAPCAFPVERTLGELRGPRVHPLEDLHAPRGIWAVDEAFFARPGPRLAEGIELLADLLHGPGRPRRSFEGRAQPAFRGPVPLYRVPTRG